MSDTYMAMLSYAEGELSTNIMHGQAVVAGLSFDNVVFYGFPSNPASITVNGAALDTAAWTFDAALGVLQVAIDAPL
ncbi:hypothetical protein GUF49_07635, partial [Xanthomonas citri pv. citri]|nr:hypothetical protein [Xanthomonas citri pv. citri]